MCYDCVHRQSGPKVCGLPVMPRSAPTLAGFSSLWLDRSSQRGADLSAPSLQLSRPTRCGKVSKTPWLLRQQADFAPVVPRCKGAPNLGRGFIKHRHMLREKAVCRGGMDQGPAASDDHQRGTGIGAPGPAPSARCTTLEDASASTRAQPTANAARSQPGQTSATRDGDTGKAGAGQSWPAPIARPPKPIEHFHNTEPTRNRSDFQQRPALVRPAHKAPLIQVKHTEKHRISILPIHERSIGHFRDCLLYTSPSPRD